MSDDDHHRLLFETVYWQVLLKNEQRYLGRGIVWLKRPCGDLADVTEAEMLDFLGIVRTYEHLVRKTFGATMFNWACLMNNAYQEEEPKPHVHWHVRPRYEKPVVVAGETFEDPNFGHHYLREDGNTRVLPGELFATVAATLRRHL